MEGFTDSYSACTPANNTPVVPVNPTPTDPSGAKNWFHHNGLYVAIGGGVLIFILLVIISWCCYKRKNVKDPYMTQKYTAADEEEIRLDEDHKNSHEALNESNGDFNLENTYKDKNPHGVKFPQYDPDAINIDKD